MTTKQLERKASELESLISAHRVVRCDMQSEHIRCVARVDLPEYGVRAGETFHLVQSSYEGYAYVVTENAEFGYIECPCKAYEFHRQCKHTKLVGAANAARYFRQHELTEAAAIAPAILGEFAQDLEQHVTDSIESGEFVDPFAGMTKAQQREAYRAMYPDDFYFAA